MCISRYLVNLLQMKSTLQQSLGLQLSTMLTYILAGCTRTTTQGVAFTTEGFRTKFIMSYIVSHLQLRNGRFSLGRYKPWKFLKAAPLPKIHALLLCSHYYPFLHLFPSSLEEEEKTVEFACNSKAVNSRTQINHLGG